MVAHSSPNLSEHLQASGAAAPAAPAAPAPAAALLQDPGPLLFLYKIERNPGPHHFDDYFDELVEEIKGGQSVNDLDGAN